MNYLIILLVIHKKLFDENKGNNSLLKTEINSLQITLPISKLVIK